MTLRRSAPPVGPVAVALLSLSMAWFGDAGDGGRATSLVVTNAEPAEESARSVTFPVAQDQGALIETVLSRPLLAPNRRVPNLISPPDEAEVLLAPIPQISIEATPEPIIEEPALRSFDLHMVGFFGQADNMRVLLRSPVDQTEGWHGLGDEISGWTLVEITQDAILLRQGEAEITIKMFE